MSPWLSWWGARWQVGRHGYGALAESLHVIHQQEAESQPTGTVWAFENSKPSDTFSNKATSTNPADNSCS